MVSLTMEIPQFFIDKVIDAPVVLVERVGRVLCTGTGPGFEPRHRAGKGWRGRWESDSQVTCHPNQVQTAVLHGQTCLTSHTSVPPPPPA